MSWRPWRLARRGDRWLNPDPGGQAARAPGCDLLEASSLPDSGLDPAQIVPRAGGEAEQAQEDAGAEAEGFQVVARRPAEEVARGLEQGHQAQGGHDGER